MKRLIVGLLVLLSPSAFAQQSPPEIPYDSVANLLKLPPDMHLGEVAGVAVNSKGHIYGNLEQSPLSAMSVLAERAVAALVPR